MDKGVSMPSTITEPKRIPVEADFLMAFSTIPGMSAVVGRHNVAQMLIPEVSMVIK